MSPAVAETPAKAKAKAKSAKEPKSKKTTSAPKKARSYPPYSEMIKEAILALKERTGSSQIAITKFIEEKQKSNLPANFKKLLFIQLKKLVANGKLVKIKNSFKLPYKATPVSDAKAPAKPKVKSAASAKQKVSGTKRKAEAKAKAKMAAKTTTAKSPAKSAAVKTPVKKVAVAAKKKTPVKVVKKPKSIKSPVKKTRATMAK